MESEELIAHTRRLQAQLLATQIAVRVLLAANPPLSAALHQSADAMEGGLLYFDLSEDQIKSASQTIRFLASPMPPDFSGQPL